MAGKTKTRSIQQGFTSGILSPSMLARNDMKKYGQGCLELLNCAIETQGAAVRRPGFRFLEPLPSQAYIYKFSFNAEQTYALVFGEGWLRIAIKDGFLLNEDGSVYEVASPYTLEQASTLYTVQSGDVVFITHQDVRPYRLTRYGHIDWRFEEMIFTAPLPAPKWGGGGSYHAYASPGKISDLPTIYIRRHGWGIPADWEAMRGSIISQPLFVSDGAGGYTPFRPNLGSYYYYWGNTGYQFNRDTTQVVKDPFDYRQMYVQGSPPVVFTNAAIKSDGTISPAQTNTPIEYFITAVDDKGREGEPSDGATVYAPSSNNWQAGDYVTVTWLPVAGAYEYRIYKGEYGGAGYYVATTQDTTWKDTNAAPIFSDGMPKWIDPFLVEGSVAPGGGSEYDFPSIVSLFQQRLVFAASKNRPQTIWLSKIGDYTNFSYSEPRKDDDSIEVTLAGEEVSRVQWLAVFRSLVAGTLEVEWEIAATGEQAFTMKSASAKPQSFIGSAELQALRVNKTIMHCDRSSNRVRTLQYNFGSDSFEGIDMTILCRSLFDGQKILRWTHQKSPDSVIWCMTDKGNLLALTFQEEHDIYAWHRHNFADGQGLYRDVCCLPGQLEDQLFAIVELDGNYYLELMGTWFPQLDHTNMLYLDHARTFTFTKNNEALTVTGLDYIEGKQVGLLADGTALPFQTVQNGSIQLRRTPNTLIVGLPYTSRGETMPIELLQNGVSTFGTKKSISSFNALMADTAHVEMTVLDEDAIPETEDWQRYPERTLEKYDHPAKWQNGTNQFIGGRNSDGNRVWIAFRSIEPLPFKILAITSNVVLEV